MIKVPYKNGGFFLFDKVRTCELRASNSSWYLRVNGEQVSSGLSKTATFEIYEQYFKQHIELDQEL